MAKANLFNLEGNKLKDIELPPQFEEEFRPDLIMRAFLAYQSSQRQSYGVFPKAGMRPSAELSRRRRKYRTAYGHGISRVPRKALWKRGRQFGWVGAFAPGTYKGRKAHPAKAEKILEKKINIKERRKAIRSALSATSIPEIIKNRGHIFEHAPIVIESKFESISNTKEVKKILENLKLSQELERTSVKKIRAGKGKSRGRKYKTRKGPLIVVSENCPLELSARNILGVDVCKINNLNVNLLAPGGIPGRLTIYLENAIERLKKENLFFDAGVDTRVIKEKKEIKEEFKKTDKTDKKHEHIHTKIKEEKEKIKSDKYEEKIKKEKETKTKGKK